MVLPISALERNCDFGRVHCSFVIVKVMGLVRLGDRLGVFVNAGMGFTSTSNIRKWATIVGLGKRWIHGRGFPE
jgi:hypothetical protein